MPAKNLRRSIVSIPLIGYLARLTKDIVSFPRIYDKLVASNNQIATRQTQISQDLDEIRKLLREDISKLNQDNASIQLALDNLQGQFNHLENSSLSNIKNENESKSKGLLFADDHIMDSFYTHFEDRLRGSESEIAKRLEVYLPYFTKSKIDFSSHPVLDIGSGRGEFIKVLADNHISSVGLDINHDMVARSNKKGLKAIQGDALSYLQSAKPQTYGAITGFHIVEHIPFNELLRILTSARRALTKDGFVIFETPNPENLVVGSTTFYLDPSHLHPLPPLLMSFTLETCGYKNVEIIRLHPNEDKKLKVSSLNKDVKDLLFGPRDYAVIGYK